MKIQSMVGILVSAALCAGMAGCNAKPISVVDVDQSVLPPPAKAMLPQDASYERVQKETYGDGNEIYVIHYTLNGEAKQIKYNPKDRTEPSSVFGVLDDESSK